MWKLILAATWKSSHIWRILETILLYLDCEISYSHRGEYEDCSLLGKNVMQSCWSRPMFQRFVQPPLSPSETSTSARLQGAISQKAVIFSSRFYFKKTYRL
jgi:hypothetical protein